MSVYKEFQNDDILHTVIHTQPQIILASGTNGWHGNTGVSGSVSLYSGIRSRSDVAGNSNSGLALYPLDPLDTFSIDRVIYVSGSYPLTASVNYVKVRNTPVNTVTNITNNDWYEEHFRPLELLYSYHSAYNFQYFTGSHDYYALYFKQQAFYAAPVVAYYNNALTTMTSAFAVEAWIKPTVVTSSLQDFTIAGQRTKWKLYITGSTGNLVFTDFASFLSSSTPLTPGIWTHVAFTATGNSGSFYENSVLQNQQAFTGSLINPAVTASHLAIGAAYVVSASAACADQGFCGYLYETKIWNTSRTNAQISSSWAKTLINSASNVNLIHYSRFNDGPLGLNHGFVQGSGAFDYSLSLSPGRLIGFDSVLPPCPVWQPNDNVEFFPVKKRIDTPLNFIRLFNIPSIYYGRQISTGSVILECHAYDRQGIVRTLRDDGRGSLYLSGSATRSISGEDYAGNTWRQVGNIFYGEGIIALTDPSLWDFGEVNFDGDHDDNALRLSFQGQQRIPVKTFMCRLDAAEFNASNNPTFSYLDPGDPDDITDDHYLVRGDTTYITAVGLYNDKKKLIAVAKLAQPIRKKIADRLTIRISYDF